MFYRFWRFVIKVLYRLVYFTHVIGIENVPEGGCMICANHSGLSDPFFIGITTDLSVKVRFMAKAELFSNKFLAWAMRKLGAFPVRRGESDLAAVKEALRVLKTGERLIIFPEGTRNSHEGARTGAGMFALRTGCKIVPAYVTPNKKLFHRVTVVYGEPYTAEAVGGDAHTQYRAAADEIMRRVYALAPKRGKA